jgi:hypothetical protein
MDWALRSCYAFPLTACIPQILKKFLKAPGCELMLVAAYWVLESRKGALFSFGIRTQGDKARVAHPQQVSILKVYSEKLSIPQVTLNSFSCFTLKRRVLFLEAYHAIGLLWQTSSMVRFYGTSLKIFP